MKNKILISALLLLVVQLQAQEKLQIQTENVQVETKQKFNVFAYEVEGINYFNVEGVKPQDKITFYSKKTGGKLLKTTYADKTGKSKLTFKETSPAFAMSSKYIEFYNHYLFKIKDIQVINTNSQKEISFQAIAGKNIRYLLYSTNLQGEQELIKEIEPNLNNWENLKINLSKHPAKKYVLVVQEESKLRYKQEFNVKNKEFLSVYPTITQDVLNVLTSTTNNNYTIYNSQGKPIKKGVLNQNTIPVSDLATGNYVLNVYLKNGEVLTERFVKQ